MGIENRSDLIIDLGSGQKPHEDATIFVDLKKINDRKTIIHDLNNLPYPFETESVNKIYATSVLEHLDLSEQAFFQECYRIMKYGGHMVFVVPNTMFIYHRLKYLMGVIPANFILTHKKHLDYTQTRNCMRNCGFNVKDKWVDLIPFRNSFVNNVELEAWKF